MNGGSVGPLIDIPAYIESKESGGEIFNKLAGFKRGEDQAAFADVPHDKVLDTLLPHTHIQTHT